MENSATTTVSTDVPAKADSKAWLKTALAWTLSLFFLFLVVYVISIAWKKGQQKAVS